jgi:hypothetical protein
VPRAPAFPTHFIATNDSSLPGVDLCAK